MLKEMLFSNALVGGSGSNIDVEELNVTENGRYYARNIAYSPVIVNVPQTTVTALTATENKIYTAPTGTAYSSVTVDVKDPNATSYSLLARQEFVLQKDTQTTEEVAQIFDVPIPDNKFVFGLIKDKYTVANGCFYGSYAFFYKISSESYAPQIGKTVIYRDSNGAIKFYGGVAGIYVTSINSYDSAYKVSISARYNPTYGGTINSTYVAEIYALDTPDGSFPS